MPRKMAIGLRREDGMRVRARGSLVAGMLLAIFFLVAATLAAGEAIERVTLKVEGLTCPSCAYRLKTALEKVPGVQRAKVTWEKGEALVEVQPGAVTVGQLIEAAKSEGFAARPLEASR